eukprot:13640886-Alexandrium_andersonii.AAC.1
MGHQAAAIWSAGGVRPAGRIHHPRRVSLGGGRVLLGLGVRGPWQHGDACAQGNLLGLLLWHVRHWELVRGWLQPHARLLPR